VTRLGPSQTRKRKWQFLLSKHASSARVLDGTQFTFPQSRIFSLLLTFGVAESTLNADHDIWHGKVSLSRLYLSSIG
jgi:hypothetical protein